VASWAHIQVMRPHSDVVPAAVFLLVGQKPPKALTVPPKGGRCPSLTTDPGGINVDPAGGWWPGPAALLGVAADQNLFLHDGERTATTGCSHP
jgi:hypothetical protein